MKELYVVNTTEMNSLPESSLGNFVIDEKLLNDAYNVALEMYASITSCEESLQYEDITFPGEQLDSEACSDAQIPMPDYSTTLNAIFSIAKAIIDTLKLDIDDITKYITSYIEALEIEEKNANDLLNFFLSVIDFIDTESSTDINAYLESLLLGMTKEEYNQYIEGVKSYYDKEIDILGKMKSTNDELLDIINAFPLTDNKTGYSEMLLDSSSLFYDNVGIALGIDLEKLYEINPDLANSYYDLHDEFIANGVYNRSTYINLLDKMVQANPQLHELEIDSYKDLIEIKKQLEYKQIEIMNSLNDAYHKKDSAEYDYLSLCSDYNNYQIPDENDLESLLLSSRSLDNMIAYGEFNDLKEISKYDSTYLKTFAYLYEQDPAKANQYMKSVEYQLNQIKGQVEAQKFLSKLGEKDDYLDRLDFITNGLRINVQGIVDGTISFGEGMNHALEAIFSLATGDERRNITVEEYKKRYIYQALLSLSDKEKIGLIVNDGSGNYTNSIIDGIVDYTKEYSGLILGNQYEFSQGVGYILPSMALSSINPLLGSLSLGISSGGNSFHNAMIEGHSIGRSILYGIASGCTEAITERFLGGLPGLSESGIGTSVLKLMKKEGLEEVYQDYIDWAYQGIILGNFEIPSTPEECVQAVLNKVKTFSYGALTAGVLNIGGERALQAVAYMGMSTANGVAMAGVPILFDSVDVNSLYQEGAIYVSSSGHKYHLKGSFQIDENGETVAIGHLKHMKERMENVGVKELYDAKFFKDVKSIIDSIRLSFKPQRNPSNPREALPLTPEQQAIKTIYDNFFGDEKIADAFGKNFSINEQETTIEIDEKIIKAVDLIAYAEQKCILSDSALEKLEEIKGRLQSGDFTVYKMQNDYVKYCQQAGITPTINKAVGDILTRDEVIAMQLDVERATEAYYARAIEKVESGKYIENGVELSYPGSLIGAKVIENVAATGDPIYIEVIHNYYDLEGDDLRVYHIVPIKDIKNRTLFGDVRGQGGRAVTEVAIFREKSRNEFYQIDNIVAEIMNNPAKANSISDQEIMSIVEKYVIDALTKRSGFSYFKDPTLQAQALKGAADQLKTDQKIIIDEIRRKMQEY